jgi:prepilin-type processing-associated H-X9-DG protein
LLFPVFQSARNSAKRISCASNFHQVSLGSLLYTSDYEDKFMVATHAPGQTGNATNDRTWVQLTLPYMRSFDVFNCPADYTRERQVRAFEPTGVAGDPYLRFYEASRRSNIGFNWLYLSPVVMQSGKWASVPRETSNAADPASTILFVDSVYEVVDGNPRGGGHYLVTPPCRYEEASGRTKGDTFSLTRDEVRFYTPDIGWGISRETPNEWGHVWPWHGKQANVARVDGSIKAMRMESLYAGRKIGPDWSGSITDISQYIWDLR